MSQVLTLPKLDRSVWPTRSASVIATLLKGRGHFFSEVVNTTPHMAVELLEKHNTLNRPMYHSRVDFYASEMRKGRWRKSSGSIGVDTQHLITNGQHRLKAIAVSGVTVPLSFVFNCDPDARAVEDCGKSRSEADRLTLSGTDADKNMVSVAKVFRFMPSFAGQATQITSIEIIREVISRFGGELQFAIDQCNSDAGGITHAVIQGCVARAALHIGKPRLAEFCTVAKSGFAVSEEDQAAAKFYSFLHGDTGRSLRAGGQIDRHRFYQYTQSAIAAFADRRVLKQIKETKEDLFPLPDLD